jgi:hypothetical protein
MRAIAYGDPRLLQRLLKGIRDKYDLVSTTLFQKRLDFQKQTQGSLPNKYIPNGPCRTYIIS